MSEFGDKIMGKCMDFSIRIVNLYKYLTEEKKEYILSKQLLRSATSVGANLAEAQSAISKKDFVAKAYISLKEVTESLYWLELLYRTDYLKINEYESLRKDCNELKSLFVSITKTITTQSKD